MTSPAHLHDRRRRAADLLDGLAAANPADRIQILRDLAAQCLGLTPVNRPPIAVTGDALPATAHIIADLANPYGPDVIAAHFDLTADAGADAANGSRRVGNPQAQAANAAVQNYAGAARSPLLIFTLPDGSGLQFIHGAPTPGSPARLLSVSRLTYQWGETNRTTLDALEQIG